MYKVSYCFQCASGTQMTIITAVYIYYCSKTDTIAMQDHYCTERIV